MKTKLLILLLFLSGAASAQQLPVQYVGGTAKVRSVFKGPLESDSSVAIKAYPDTVTANMGIIRFVDGLMIRVGDTLFIRDYSRFKWVKIFTGNNFAGSDSVTLHIDVLCQWKDGTSKCYDLGKYIYTALMNYNFTKIIWYDIHGNKLDSLDLHYSPVRARDGVAIKDTVIDGKDGFVFFGTSVGGSVVDTAFRFPVLDSLNDPPVSPLTNDIYLVGDIPTGLWAGNAKKIATWDGTIWNFDSPTIGDLLFRVANGMVSKWTTVTWVRVGKLLIHVAGDGYGIPITVGTTDVNSFSLITNKIARMVFASNGTITLPGSAGGGTRLFVVNNAGALTGLANGTNGQILKLVTALPTWADAAADSTTASNGLTLTVKDVRLGGPLTNSPTITAGANRLSITTSTIGSNPFRVSSGTGSAIVVSTTGGIGYDYTGTGTGMNVVVTNGSAGFMKSSNAAAVLDIQGDNSSPANIIPIITQSRITSSTAAAGIGLSNTFAVEYDAGVSDQTNSFISKWLNATGASRLSQLSITGNNAGGLNRLMAFGGDGLITIDSLAGTKYLTADTVTHKPVVVDASGNLGRGYWSGGGGTPVSFSKEEFTGSTSGTITVAHTYTAGSGDVFKNGILLSSSEYTEATGTTFTLTAARLSTDIIIVKYRY